MIAQATQAHTKSPGDVLSELLNKKGISQTDLASQLSMNRTYLNQVIKGRYPLSADLRLKLEPILGVKPSYWTDIERSYSAWQRTPVGQDQIREQDEDRIRAMLDARGASVLLSYEIEMLIKAKLLVISNLDLEDEVDRMRLEDTCLQLTFGPTALRDVLIKDEGEKPRVETQDVSLKAGFTLVRGQQVTFSTREHVRIPRNFRMVINGLTDPWCTQAVNYYCPRVLMPGNTAPISFKLVNSTLLDLEVMESDPCLSVSFEYVPQLSSP